jgi:hypothetical protein
MINGSGPGIPELRIESCDAKSADDAVADPDEAGDPEEYVIFALEDRDVADLLDKTGSDGRGWTYASIVMRRMIDMTMCTTKKSSYC